MVRKERPILTKTDIMLQLFRSHLEFKERMDNLANSLLPQFDRSLARSENGQIEYDRAMERLTAIRADLSGTLAAAGKTTEFGSLCSQYESGTIPLDVYVAGIERLLSPASH